MINKHNLWFITLFSMILVLGIYYVTIPSEVLKDVQKKVINVKKNKSNKALKNNEVIEESRLTAMRVNLQEERSEQVNIIQEKLTNEELSGDEKNNLYEQLKYLNEIQSKEEKIEKKIKTEFKLDCFNKIDNSNISITCISDEHNETIANKIMRSIQSEFDEKKSITVNFQKK